MQLVFAGEKSGGIEVVIGRESRENIRNNHSVLLKNLSKFHAVEKKSCFTKSDPALLENFHTNLLCLKNFCKNRFAGNLHKNLLSWKVSTITRLVEKFPNYFVAKFPQKFEKLPQKYIYKMLQLKLF